MRVFISSVRTGLEEERDALRGIILAVGHTPVRFEDFTAQNEPSREACLSGMANSDVYLLLLGPRYGHTFPDTGQSPTHEEWTAATVAGLRRIVYRKSGVQFEPEQHKLAQAISDYTVGVFRDTFSTTPELLIKVAAKLSELDTEQGDLDFGPLSSNPEFEWRTGFETRREQNVSGSQLEVHVMPQPPAPYSARVMAQLGDSLADRIRASGFVDSTTALSKTSDGNSTSVTMAIPQPRSWEEPRDGETIGIRLAKTGQISAWATLPADSMGSVLDPNRLTEQIAGILCFVGALSVVESKRVAIGAGIDPIGMLTVGIYERGRSRNQATGIKMSGQPLRVLPDESISIAAISTGAAEVASHVARELVDGFHSL